jgi:hypothetical protein
MDVCTWFGIGCDGYEAGSWDGEGEGVITSIVLNDNGLEGKLVGDVSALSSLISLELHSNYIEGGIPPSWYGMKSLEVLFLDDNYISGTLDESIGTMNLKRLTLADNEISGSIPESIGDMSGLVMLWLFDNEKMGGGIPESLGGLANLGEYCCGYFPFIYLLYYQTLMMYACINIISLQRL